MAIRRSDGIYLEVLSRRRSSTCRSRSTCTRGTTWRRCSRRSRVRSPSASRGAERARLGRLPIARTDPKATAANIAARQPRQVQGRRHVPARHLDRGPGDDRRLGRRGGRRERRHQRPRRACLPRARAGLPSGLAAGGRRRRGELVSGQREHWHNLPGRPQADRSWQLVTSSSSASCASARSRRPRRAGAGSATSRRARSGWRSTRSAS